MRKQTLAFGVALGMAIASGPALAAKFVVENGAGQTVYGGCGNQYSVNPGYQSLPIECPYRIHIRLDPAGDAAIHPHDCHTPARPVHKVRVTDSGAAGTVQGLAGLRFSHSCE